VYLNIVDLVKYKYARICHQANLTLILLSFVDMTELLFEGYKVPSVAYGIDSLFSYHANGGSVDDGGIIISSGNATTHIIPTLGGKGVLSKTKR
jgi:actin-related protein